MQYFENIPGIEARIEALKNKLAARDGKKEYIENCNALRAEIASLETKLASLKPVASDGA